MDEMFKASSDASAVLKVAPNEHEEQSSPFRLRHGMPLFQFYKEHPPLAARFAQAMAGVSRRQYTAAISNDKAKS